jgi:hypothetical protein
MSAMSKEIVAGLEDWLVLVVRKLKRRCSVTDNQP